MRDQPIRAVTLIALEGLFDAIVAMPWNVGFDQAVREHSIE